jgi:DNA-binding MurR/RpiR family transcriptional regulator
MKQMIILRQGAFSKYAEQVLRTSLERPEIVALGTAKSLAQSSGVAQTTVLRAIKTLGFERFAAYRAIFRVWLVNQSKELSDRPRP